MNKIMFKNFHLYTTVYLNLPYMFVGLRRINFRSFPYMGLFCLHREISLKQCDKNSPNAPKNKSGLTQLIMMVESIHQNRV